MSKNSLKPSTLPRGLRNNNPLNIRIGNVWLGERNDPDDPLFEQFVSLEYGLRAAFVLLRRYINHYRRTTPQAIISAWAPASENNVPKYVTAVCRRSGLAPDSEIDYSDMATMVKLVEAMAYVECGQPIKPDVIVKGYRLA